MFNKLNQIFCLYEKTKIPWKNIGKYDKDKDLDTLDKTSRKTNEQKKLMSKNTFAICVARK